MDDKTTGYPLPTEDELADLVGFAKTLDDERLDDRLKPFHAKMDWRDWLKPIEAQEQNDDQQN